LFLRRIASESAAGYVTGSLSEVEDPDDPLAIGRRAVPDGVEVFEVKGALFFGAATKFRDALGAVEAPPRVLILRLRHVLSIDATGLRAVEVLLEECRRKGTALVLSGVHAQPLVAFERSGLLARVGPENAHPDIDAALARARELIGDQGPGPSR
jgi:SulP family sulfate permease